MYRENFLCLCRWTIFSLYIILMRSISDRNNMYNFKTFEEYLRELKLAQKERQTEYMNTFQLYWNMLKRKLRKNFFLPLNLSIKLLKAVSFWFAYFLSFCKAIRAENYLFSELKFFNDARNFLHNYCKVYVLTICF